jgi:ABC-2 type transport system ATP-binding protein
LHPVNPVDPGYIAPQEDSRKCGGPLDQFQEIFSMSPSPALVICGLSKSYGTFQALKGVDLEVRRGEIFGFLGPNGSGKTTTIRCLLDLIRPSGGSIRVLDLDPQLDPVAVRARVGYLPGELRIDDNMTAEGALKFFNRLRGGKADWTFVRELARRLALDLQTPIKNFSKGNKQKVGVVQALMHRPELLLLDEPTSGLDPLAQQKVLELVGEARAAGATVFFSSHVLSEVQEIAGRVAILRAGLVVEVAETQTLIHRAVRRVRIRFKQPQDSIVLKRLPGVRLLSRDGQGSILLQVEGEMDGLIKALAAFPVSDFETERPSLEEIFLAYYEGK